MKRVLFYVALFFGAVSGVDAQVNPSVVTQFHTTTDLVDGYYITSKCSGRILTKTSNGTQIYQSALFSSATVSELQTGQISMGFNGYATNPAGFAAGVYPVYKLQWGGLAPYTLSNSFFDLVNGFSNPWGAPIVTNPAANSGTNQNWVFIPTGDGDGSFFIRSLQTGLYMQIGGAENHLPGALLEQGYWGGRENQKFYFHRMKATNRVGEVVDGSEIVNTGTVEFSLYPNPTDDKLIINLAGEGNSVSVIDVNGSKVGVTSVSIIDGFELEVSSLDAGTYFVLVTDAQGNISTEKFVKK